MPPTQPSASAGMQTFDVKTYDATNFIESACTCFWCPCVGWTTKQLILETEEAVLKVDNNCQHSVQKRPYAQLGQVESVNSCICCYGIQTDITRSAEDGGKLSRGFGCDKLWAMEVTNELQSRKVGRGNIAQIQAQEVLAQRVDHLHTKLDLILAHLKLEVPAPPAIGQAVMERDGPSSANKSEA